MSRNLFGWSYPPGVSQNDIDNAYGTEMEPTKESEHVATIFEELHAKATDPQKAEDAIVEYVDNLARELQEAVGLLHAANRLLPKRGPEPPCTCKDAANYGWCELHSADWYEPTLNEEVTSFLERNKKKTDEPATNTPHAFVEEEEQPGYCRCGEDQNHPIHDEK